MNKYKFYNNLLGWVVFAIALITYLLTIEPTASWWDCGEFIASAFKLEVGHPPGAPLFSALPLPSLQTAYIRFRLKEQDNSSITAFSSNARHTRKCEKGTRNKRFEPRNQHRANSVSCPEVWVLRTLSKL